jgi:hypothetical protein
LGPWRYSALRVIKAVVPVRPVSSVSKIVTSNTGCGQAGTANRSVLRKQRSSGALSDYRERAVNNKGQPHAWKGETKPFAQRVRKKNPLYSFPGSTQDDLSIEPPADVRLLAAAPLPQPYELNAGISCLRTIPAGATPRRRSSISTRLSAGAWMPELPAPSVTSPLPWTGLRSGLKWSNEF